MWSTSNVSTEDFNSDNLQRLGFTGQHSEVSWLHRLRCVVEQRGAGLFTSPSSTQDSLPFISFYQDTTNIGILEKIDWIGRPSQSTASELLETYFGKFHGSFPIIGKVPIQAQYRVFSSRADVRPGKQWLAVLNLVFAIATTHLSHIGHHVSSNETHVEFFSRAWKLCMNKDSLRREHFPNSARERSRWRPRIWLGCITIPCPRTRKSFKATYRFGSRRNWEWKQTAGIHSCRRPRIGIRIRSCVFSLHGEHYDSDSRSGRQYLRPRARLQAVASDWGHDCGIGCQSKQMAPFASIVLPISRGGWTGSEPWACQSGLPLLLNQTVHLPAVHSAISSCAHTRYDPL